MNDIIIQTESEAKGKLQHVLTIASELILQLKT